MRAEVKTILYNIISRIPDKTLLLYSPILGIIIYVIASIFNTLYYLHISPSEVLKEV